MTDFHELIKRGIFHMLCSRIKSHKLNSGSLVSELNIKRSTAEYEGKLICFRIPYIAARSL